MKNPHISLDEAKKCLDYDPLTGIFTHKRAVGRAPLGSRAGRSRSKTSNDYWVTTLHCRKYYLHRLAWLFVYGEHPSDNEMIDHINQIKSDNRIENLRLASSKDNKGNYPIISTNTSGYRGVSWDKKGCFWAAYICPNGKKKHIGCFRTAEEAARAYDKRAREYFGIYYADLNFPEIYNEQ